MYTVKQAAAILGMSQHAVRFYTDKGLVPGLTRDKNNARQFDEQAIHWLTGVKYLKACGMPLAEIARFMHLCVQGDETLGERHEILKRQTEIARVRLAGAQRTATYMEGKLAHYEQITAQAIPDDMNPGTW